MKFRSLKNLILFGVSIFAITQGCAPSKAFQVREMRTVTVGLPLGAVYRPSGDFAVGAGYSRLSDQTEKVTTRHVEQTEDGSKKFTEYQIERDYAVVRPYFHYYPWQDSAFFIGAGVDYQEAQLRLKEEEEAASGRKTYDITTVNARMPMGWSWIWENGVSAVLDIGPTIGGNQSIRENTSEDAAEEDAKGQQTRTDLAKFERGGLISPLLLLGYSF